MSIGFPIPRHYRLLRSLKRRVRCGSSARRRVWLGDVVGGGRRRGSRGNMGVVLPTHPPRNVSYSGGHPQTPVRGGKPPLYSPRAVSSYSADDHKAGAAGNLPNGGQGCPPHESRALRGLRFVAGCRWGALCARWGASASSRQHERGSSHPPAQERLLILGDTPRPPSEGDSPPLNSPRAVSSYSVDDHKAGAAGKMPTPR